MLPPFRGRSLSIILDGARGGEVAAFYSVNGRAINPRRQADSRSAAADAPASPWRAANLARHSHPLLQRSKLRHVADALGQGACALAGDFDEAGIVGDLLKRGQQALRLGKNLAVQVGLKLQQGLIHAQAVVLHAALELDQMLLLPRQTFEDLHQLVGCGVQGVVEADLVGLPATLVAKGLLAEIGDARSEEHTSELQSPMYLVCRLLPEKKKKA